MQYNPRGPRICKYFQQGSCKKGDRCDFPHGEVGSQQPMSHTGPGAGRRPRPEDDYPQAQKRNPRFTNYQPNTPGPNQNSHSQFYQPQTQYPQQSDWQSNKMREPRPQKNRQAYFNDLQELGKMPALGFVKFLPVFHMQKIPILGIVCEKDVIFYQLNFSNPPNILDTFNFQNLNINLNIQNAWIQTYGDDALLIVSYKTNPQASTVSLILYISIIKDRQNQMKIQDVCNGLIQGCYMDLNNQHLYVFSQDKQIRVFTYDAQTQSMVLGHSFQVSNPIECSVQINSNTFLFGGQNGLLGSLSNGNLNTYDILKDKNIIEIVQDQENKRFFALVWDLNNSSEVFIITENLQLQGPVYQFNKRITKISHFQNIKGQNILLVGNIYGTVVELFEKTAQQQQSLEMMNESSPYVFQKYNQYPQFQHQPQQFQGPKPRPPQLPPIRDILPHTHINQNNVQFKYLFIGRPSEPNQIEGNIIFFEMTMPPLQ